MGVTNPVLATESGVNRERKESREVESEVFALFQDLDRLRTASHILSKRYLISMNVSQTGGYLP